MTDEQTLLQALEILYPDSSRRTLRIWLKNKRVTLDGSVITQANHLVKKGQKVVLEKPKPSPIKEFQVLFEDPDIVIIDKPVGLLSVPLDEEPAKSALEILCDYYKTEIFAVHRIDKGTSGVLVFAKTEAGRTGMDELFKSHDLHREYIALVEGHVKIPKGTWKSYLKERSFFEMMATEDHNEGRLAITHYEVLGSTAKCTWLRMILETGRKHQIRVHCRDAGHPILGDKRYGSKMNPYKRLCLHALRISFKHPVTGEKIDVRAKTKTVNFLKEMNF